MQIKIAGNLRLETDIPFLNVDCFQLHWKPNEHAILLLEGFINNKIPYRMECFYDSRLTLTMEREKNEQTLFYGYIVKVEPSIVAGMNRVSLCVSSGSCLLDRIENSRSFQSVETTYSETVRQSVESAGGNVICTIGKDKEINRPLIQFEETAWEFSRRLASHLESVIIPDIETGRSNIWFGMRKGKTIMGFSQKEYKISVKHNSRGSGVRDIVYEVESGEFYKIGDQTIFLNEAMTIFEVSAYFKDGELLFHYRLSKTYMTPPLYQKKFTGLSLPGIILEAKDEQINVGLDIDHNVSTGGYFYPWYSHIGNAFYAMPEKGARIMLYFPNEDERNGFSMECFPERKKKYSYRDRCAAFEDGNFIRLFDNLLSISKDGNQSVSLSDGSISIGTSRPLTLAAESKVRMRAKRIYVCSEDEISVYKC